MVLTHLLPENDNLLSSQHGNEFVAYDIWMTRYPDKNKEMISFTIVGFCYKICIRILGYIENRYNRFKMKIRKLKIYEKNKSTL